MELAAVWGIPSSTTRMPNVLMWTLEVFCTWMVGVVDPQEWASDGMRGRRDSEHRVPSKGQSHPDPSLSQHHHPEVEELAVNQQIGQVPGMVCGARPRWPCIALNCCSEQPCRPNLPVSAHTDRRILDELGHVLGHDRVLHYGPSACRSPQRGCLVTPKYGIWWKQKLWMDRKLTLGLNVACKG